MQVLSYNTKRADKMPAFGWQCFSGLLGDLVCVLKHFSNDSLKLGLPQPVGVTATIGVREEQFWAERIKVQV